METMQRTFLRVLQRSRSCRKIGLNSYQIPGRSQYGNVMSPKCHPTAEFNTWSAMLVWRKTLLQSLPAVQLQMRREMAGHNKYSNIKHRKEAQDNKKATLMNQFVRLAKTAVKEGGSTDPKLNQKLAQVLEAVKKQSLSIDTFNKILDKLSKKGLNSKEHMLEVAGPGNSIFLVLLDSDNVSLARTDLKAALKKLPVKLQNTVTSLHFFKQQGIVYVTPDPNRPNLDLEEVAIECDAEDVVMETNEEGHKVIKFLCDPTRLMEVKSLLEEQNLTVESLYEDYSPLMPVTPTEAEQEEIDTIIERLEGVESFVQMYTNVQS